MTIETLPGIVEASVEPINEAHANVIVKMPC